jgi:hypothetical protein
MVSFFSSFIILPSKNYASMSDCLYDSASISMSDEAVVLRGKGFGCWLTPGVLLVIIISINLLILL